MRNTSCCVFMATITCACSVSETCQTRIQYLILGCFTSYLPTFTGYTLEIALHHCSKQVYQYHTQPASNPKDEREWRGSLNEECCICTAHRKIASNVMAAQFMHL